LVEEELCSVRTGCEVMGIKRSIYYYEESGGEFEKRLVLRMHEISKEKPRYGYRRMWNKLRGEGWKVNKKRIQRLMRKEGLKVVVKAKKRRRTGHLTNKRKKAEYRNHVWSWDMLFDRTEDGRQLKILTILDEYTRKSLGIKVDRHITSADVIRILRELVKKEGIPRHIRSDNGPEFIAKAIERWVTFNKVETIYIKPGSPWENPYIESFNGTPSNLSRECKKKIHFLKV